jgi:predicted Zn-dependent protease
MKARTLVLCVSMALCASGCAHYAVPSYEPFLPSRHDYDAFRGSHPDVADQLLEPNYLPFMAHRMEVAGKNEDVVVFCRWDESEFPLAVHVEPPRILPELQDEFDPQEPDVFVEAAWRALENWQEAVAGVPTFRRAKSWTDADLRIELMGEQGPAPQDGVQVLGTTSLARACRVHGRGLVQDRLDVSFRVPVVRLYLADQHGLLLPDQIERNVLHEMGHALGMKGHSPIPADLMYEVARDRRVSKLSRQDTNSFGTLYAIPNGTIYARIPRDAATARPPAEAPIGPVQLSENPYVDARLGYSLHVPPGWRLIPARRGVVAIDGLSWDYEGSFQVIVHSYPTIASYVRRHGKGHLRDGELLAQQPMIVAGQPAFHIRVAQRDGTFVEDHVFVETGDGRVIVVIQEAPTDLRAGFAPWFDAMLASLQILPSQLPGLRSPSGAPSASRQGASLGR